MHRFAPVVLFAATAAVPVSAQAAGTPAPSPDFLRYWKSGLAELSSYAVTVERYGEMRRGQRVLVFVYEEINADTRVKVESPKTPPARQVPVLKLNDVLKFNTGVYDYSVMTSVFAGLSGPGVKRFLEPRKISFTSQEWCGHVYHHLIPGPKSVASEIHSYFGSEGDDRAVIPYTGRNIRYADELPILIRELDGPVLAEGDSLEMDLFPSLWDTRKAHTRPEFAKASLRKAGRERRKTPAGDSEAVKWILTRGEIATTFWVEAQAPRKLLAWENNRGEKGELLKSLRKTYWELNRNRDEGLRKELGLTFGVGGG